MLSPKTEIKTIGKAKQRAIATQGTAYVKKRMFKTLKTSKMFKTSFEASVRYQIIYFI